MTKRDQVAIVVRVWLLILVIAIASNMWRHPEGWWHYIEIVVVVLALNVRERVSYYWRRDDRTLWGGKLAKQPETLSDRPLGS